MRHRGVQYVAEGRRRPSVRPHEAHVPDGGGRGEGRSAVRGGVRDANVRVVGMTALRFAVDAINRTVLRYELTVPTCFTY